MRKALCLALAKYSGQVLTREVALDLLADLFPDRSIDPAQFVPEQVGGYRLQCEAFRRSDEVHALNAAYHRETDRTGDALDFDYDRLAEMAQAGQLVQFTGRLASSGELVGVMRLYVATSTRTQQLSVSDDLLYIDPAHRSLQLASRLWRYAERSMFALGAREATFTCIGEAARLARFMGYGAVATQFSKTHQGDDYAARTTRHQEVNHDSQL